jgi:predicted esterase
MVRRRAFSTGVAALAICLLAACNPTPDKDAFYTPPTTLTGSPGDVIRSRTSVFTLDPAKRTPVPGTKSWQVLYRSTSATGTAIAVSGTVIVPTTPWVGTGSRPLVSYAVGTRGVGDACAPSYTLANGIDYEGAFIASALSRGWAVAVSDYQGLGTPGQHTYVVGQAEGRAVLDIARAVERLSGTGLSATSPVGLMGYSQGGGGAAWAAQLAPTYAPELKLKGAAMGGVPADLTAVADALDGSPFVALALLASIGYDAAYPELHLSNYLNDRGRALLQSAKDLCLVSYDGLPKLIDTAFSHISDYVTTNPLTTPTWQNRLNQNKLGATQPTTPVFVFHALFDEMVAYPQAAALRRTWCNEGATVTWATYPVAEHVAGMVEGAPAALDYLSARFAGIPAVGNCLLP